MGQHSVQFLAWTGCSDSPSAWRAEMDSLATFPGVRCWVAALKSTEDRTALSPAALDSLVHGHMLCCRRVGPPRCCEVEHSEHMLAPAAPSPVDLRETTLSGRSPAPPPRRPPSGACSGSPANPTQELRQVSAGGRSGGRQEATRSQDVALGEPEEHLTTKSISLRHDL